MKRFALLGFLMLFLGCRSADVSVEDRGPAPVPSPPSWDAFDVVDEVYRFGSEDLWPGFDPRLVPMAIYDGERTLFFRPPDPPAESRPVPGHLEVWALDGRHPAVTANSSAAIGGVESATMMLGSSAMSLREAAALLIHEAYHVHQREYHPAWSANEADLFTYPLDDLEGLVLRRLESEALRRALKEKEGAVSQCWAWTALDLRRQRFAALSPESVAYERQSELNEGLATWIEYRVLARPVANLLPERGFKPERVRERSYATGAALATLLDRFSSGWRADLVRNDRLHLDEMLDRRLPGSPAACSFSREERRAIELAAATDVERLIENRQRQKDEFLARPGWRLVVTAESMPLFPQRFDPLNVQVLGEGAVLHGRFLQLGNAYGTVEVLARESLTEPAGRHPLFEGVRTLTITGLEEPSVLRQNGTGISLSIQGITLELRDATVEARDEILHLRLP
jgi:hypothetical protein